VPFRGDAFERSDAFEKGDTFEKNWPMLRISAQDDQIVTMQHNDYTGLEKLF